MTMDEDYKEIKVDREKTVYVFDNVFDLAWRSSVVKTAQNSLFKIGFNDTEELPYSEFRNLHSNYSLEEFQHLKFVENINNVNLLFKIANLTPSRVTLNLSQPGDVYFAHTHPGLSLLYYVNTQWKEEWAGETLFFSENLSEVLFTSVYKPGRVILFDGSIPHTIRGPSRIAPGYRFTLAIFYKLNK